MSWMQKLSETYDYAMSVGNTDIGNNPLPPIGFKVETVTVEVLLSAEGGLIDAVALSEDEQQMSVPATPESIVARGAPVKPHPFFDKAKYLGGNEQMRLLKQWCEDETALQELKVVYDYLSKHNLVADLTDCFATKGIKNKPEDSFIRFRIQNPSMATPYWKSEEFIKSWKKQFDELCSDIPQELCYVTGAEEPTARKHPVASSTAMLVSMVDKNCIGRFDSNASAALSIGLATTLKAHSARRWLITRQGRYVYGMEIVAWDTGAIGDSSLLEPDPYETALADTGIINGEALAKASKGYWSNMLTKLSGDEKKRSDIVIMCTEAATNGRLSIVYYQECSPKDYVDNLMHWYTGCAWHRYSKDKGGNIVFSPWLKDICDLVYGKRDDKSNKKLKCRLSKELIPCIMAKKPLARSLVVAVFNKISNPLSYTSGNGSWDGYTWNNSLSVACALIRKYYFDKGDEHPMALNENDTNRDYLYGRLLAYADGIEQKALRQSEGNRTTNAMRYMQRFQQRPAQTWLVLRTQKLPPYLDRLKPSLRAWYERQICLIESMFNEGDFDFLQPLGPRFLEGFSNQKTYRPTDNKNIEEE